MRTSIGPCENVVFTQLRSVENTMFILRAQKIVGWFRNLELAVLVAAGVLAVSGLVLMKVIDEVIEGDTAHVDHAVMHYVAALELSPTLREAVRDVTALGGLTVLTLLCGAVLANLAVRRQWAAGAFLLIASAGALVVSMVLKHYFDRERPQIFEHGSYTLTASFPSGHAMLSTTIYLTLAVLLARLEASPWVRAFYIMLAIMIAFLVGVSRVLLGVHWPSDVLAGWCAGVAWAVVAWFCMRALQKRQKIETPI